jgi:hypothetical protein
MSIAGDFGGGRPRGRVETQSAEEASRAAKERLRDCSIAPLKEPVKEGLRERYYDVDDYDPVLRYHCRL